MTRIKHSVAALVTVAALVAGAFVATSVPSAAADADVSIATTAAEHAAEAARYDQEAADLDAKASRHTDLAAGYAGRTGAGSKQATANRSISRHCERLAKAYRAAATEAREMAKMHREMMQGG